MAVKYFKGKKITYWISENQKNINKTYRSELVWYSYWKAGVTYKIPAASLKGWKYPSVIRPYDS